ncbi:MAG TPA: G-D-S-L family lipolytic protein [Flavobacteriaceae bacterium]|nr:G-D-S-L family lipolytic protein [Flavobacteriaceae bacterium]MCB9212647.1 G-D-S-L family lipolytic protein [Alteromonas sp.]HPF11492.1 G-D-S-L family lipolytic protein [Flavobacteriaceae bacterium]HQU21025.1 G-D-S-L family lipolytic protein [Flavobacteriaceae bacterium]HQU65926.1 G-D-S-L family lipolytic protein [Flavobacteriaceae bacterium]
MKTKYIGLLLIALGFVGCNEDDSTSPDMMTVELTAGSADFSNYVAIGASFTAGFTDGALFVAGQDNSFPNILSQQFAAIGGGNFNQPYTSDNVGGLLYGGNLIANPRLYFNGSGPAVLEANPTTEVTSVVSGPFNNMGVPGAKSFHFVANGYGNLAGVPLGLANPYYARMASGANASILADALAQGPSFFSLSEVGGNDVLSFATSGGSGVDQTGNFDPSTYGSNDITDPTVFANVFSSMVGALTATGAKGVVTNVPYVTNLPYFTTVPYAPLDPTDPDFGPQIPVLNATFAPLNQAFAFLGMPERSIVFSETAASPVVIFDETLPNISEALYQVLLGGGLDPLTAQLLSAQFAQSRQATADDLMVLPSANVIGTLNEDYFNQLIGLGVPAATAGQLAINGITYPMEDQWVLTGVETQSVITATNAYNTTISSVASSSGVALVDLKGILEEASTSGVAFDNFTMTTDLVFGGLVSLDGVHLTARGYALMANKFLEAIDAAYGSNFIEAGQVAKANHYVVNYPPELQ